MSIEIEAREGDDDQFVRMVRRVLLGTLAGSGPLSVAVVRIDGWFGQRYVDQDPPEFPPERIVEERRTSDGDGVSGRGVTLWFSGNSAAQLTGSIMVRATDGESGGDGWSGGWHASFVREDAGWSFRKSKGIGPSQFAQLIERGHG